MQTCEPHDKYRRESLQDIFICAQIIRHTCTRVMAIYAHRRDESFYQSKQTQDLDDDKLSKKVSSERSSFDLTPMRFVLQVTATWAE